MPGKGQIMRPYDITIIHENGEGISCDFRKEKRKEATTFVEKARPAEEVLHSVDRIRNDNVQESGEFEYKYNRYSKVYAQRLSGNCPPE